VCARTRRARKERRVRKEILELKRKADSEHIQKKMELRKKGKRKREKKKVSTVCASIPKLCKLQ
jgi:hypothetical protein